MAKSAKKRKSGSRSKGQDRRWGKFFLIAAMVGLVGLAVFLFIGYLVVRNYLHSDKFRVLVSSETSKALEAEGEFEDFDWEGKSMYTKSFSAKGSEAAFFSRMKAHEIRAKVSLGGVSRGVWEIPIVEINKFDFVISDAQIKEDAAAEEEGGADAGEGVETSNSSSGGGFLSGLIPSEVEIQDVKIKEVNFNVITEGRLIEGRGLKARLKPTSATDGYSLSGDSGTIVATGYPELKLDNFNARTGDERVYLDHAELRFYESGKVQVSGMASTADDAAMEFNGVLAGLDLADVLAEDWVKKFKGKVNGKFKVERTGLGGGELVTSGTLNLRDGSLEAMPVLKRIDTLAGTTRFRKLNFTNVEVEFEKVGTELELGEVLFESAGLGCLKGYLNRDENGVKDGMFMLGVAPDTIKFLAVGRKEIVEQVFNKQRVSAFAEVFPGSRADDVTMPSEGYRWMVARIDPSSPDPYTADVRRQFIEAGGLAIWAELQGLSEKMVKAAGEVASVAGDQGIDLIELLAEEGLGTNSLLLTEGMIEKMGETLKIDDLFEEGTAIPKAIIDSGFDVIKDLNPLAPKD